ncbi:GNAT family N-acetyltransferase [Parabacteroides sp. FAFU027]|uniref:GNAT family N-acetyltransferase n=1 Tax=Parabacteroides sp. FAFU027 TaxID=2922715 RepID=UPI001FAF3927|nr:GNAT family N-acetyltransferase [Parabacteroides sp. FAFU027]
MGEFIRKNGIIQRLVDESDAEFILSLRLDSRLSRYLSKTENDLQKQIDWIREYKKRESEKLEFYFITVDEEGNRYGVNRIYNFKNDSFEVGSWLFAPSTPNGVSIISDLNVREFGFEAFGFNCCRFEVRKNNLSVLTYHKRFNPDLVAEDDLNYYFRLTKEQFQLFKNKLLRIYGNGN